MSKLNGNALQIGNNGTATQNCTLIANGDGTFTLARGNVGATTQDLLTIDSSGVVELTQKDQIKSGTVIATTSGTSHDFTGIPSWVKKITLMVDGLSTNGSSNYYLRLGDSGGIVATGYLGSSGRIIGTSPTTQLETTGFAFVSGIAATYIQYGIVTLTLLDASTNTWVASGMCSSSNAAGMYHTSGSVTLSGVLDRIRVTTGNGTDTFDAGKINILYEG